MDLKQQIINNIQKVDKLEDLSELLKFTNRFSIKPVVNKFSESRNYRDNIRDGILDSFSNNLTEDEVNDLLLTIESDQLLHAKKILESTTLSSFETLVNPDYRDILKKVKVPLYRDISGKIGELGDVGKGEYFLDILSHQIHRRGAPGDLNICGEKVELKAGENGRLGPAGSMSLAGRFAREYLPILQKINSNISDTVNPLDFNPKQNMECFSNHFNNRQQVVDALTELFKMHYPEYDVATMADTIVSDDGAISGNAIKSEMLKASFSVYKSAKEFDAILILDNDVTKFLYFDTAEKLASYSDFVSVSFPSWVDTQSNAMKITLKKIKPII
jgi:hypothetical protein